MRPFVLPAVVIALACAPAAHACCFLKMFCCKSAGPVAGPVTGPVVGPVVGPLPDQGPGGAGITMIPTTLGRPVIVSIAGQTPVSGSIPSPIDATVAITIIVETPYDPGASSDLTIEDLGAVSVPTKGKGKDKDKDTEKGGPPGAKKHYKPKHVIKKERPHVMAAPAPGAPVPTAGSVGRVYWEAEYEIPMGDLLPGHRYRATATAGTMSSDPVTFETRP